MGMDGQFTHSNFVKTLKWLGRKRIFCFRCGGELHPGDEYHRAGKLLIYDSHRSCEPSGNPFCRYYHRSCFEEMFLEC